MIRLLNKYIAITHLLRGKKVILSINRNNNKKIVIIGIIHQSPLLARSSFLSPLKVKQPKGSQERAKKEERQQSSSQTGSKLARTYLERIDRTLTLSSHQDSSQYPYPSDRDPGCSWASQSTPRSAPIQKSPYKTLLQVFGAFLNRTEVLTGYE